MDPERKVLHYLQGYAIPVESRVLVACSGGPDSQALLHILSRLKSNHPLILIAAHLDHGIRARAEADSELELVRETCASLDLRLVWERIDRGSLQRRAAAMGRSLEEVAREARYDFLERTAAGEVCDYIAVGHTADDQIETLFIRFLQGVDLTGLPGIPEKRGHLIRPLFECSRQELLAYLGARRIGYRIDPSNADVRYLRNAVRQRILPVVQETFPGFRGSLLSLSKKLTRLRAFVELEAKNRIIWQRYPGGYRIRGELFLKLPGILRVFSLAGLLSSLDLPRRRIPYRFLSQIESDEHVRNRGVVLAGNGVRLFWRGQDLIFTEDIVGSREKGYFIVVRSGRAVVVPQAGLACQAPVGGKKTDQSIVVLRSRRAGDSIATEKGNKALRKLFSEWRIPRNEGWRVPVLEDRNGILAVLAGLLGYKDKFRAGTPTEKRKALKSTVYRYDVEVE